MRKNKKGEGTRLKEVWPLFLKNFIVRIKQLFKGKFSIKCENKNKDSLLIYFDFNQIKGKDIYHLLARISEMVNTKGVLRKLTFMLAKITNLAVKDGNFNNFQTRGDSIYRGICRYK